MGRRSLTGAIAVAASLLVLALPAVSRAQAGASPSATHLTSAYLRTLATRGYRECIQPPRHFDLNALSDAQLALFGLPTRSVLERNPGYWEHMLAHYKHRACGPEAVMPRNARQKIPRARADTSRSPARPEASQSTQGWAGNYATGVPGTYKAAQVTFNVPYVSGHTGSLATFWAGVGGNLAFTNGPELVQAGVGVMICPNGWTSAQCIATSSYPNSGGTWRYNFAWYQILTSAARTNTCPQDLNYCLTTIMTGDMSIYPSDSMSAYVSSNAPGQPYDYFAVCNNTRGTCDIPPQLYNSDSFSDSATGECIGEEAEVTNPHGTDYWEANYGTEQLSGCYIEDNSGLGQGIQDWPHSFSWGTNAEGYTLQSVGSITNGTDYPLYYCPTQTTTNDFCG